jgi:flagellar FliL protein
MSATEENELVVTPQKSSIGKIIIIAVTGILIIAGSIAGTLYFTGFFTKKNHSNNTHGSDAPEGAETGIPIQKELIGEHNTPNTGHETIASAPERIQKKSPDFVRFEYSYKQMDKELLSNLTGTRKVIMVEVAFMTSYDGRVFKNVEKHEFAIRSAMLDEMRQYTEADTLRPEFRKELADKLKDAANAVLERYEDFGGIDAIHFTSFIIQ